MVKPPPEPIEEMPPEEKPEGENVTWIPGYWAWDDERKDYLWISGTWRALPPGRAWIAGYWAQTAQGYQWTSGYWADAAQQESTYLPPPPATIEAGPNVAAPSSDYVWMPGCWMWTHDHYAWRPGYWTIGRADWDWVPAHYVWTPRGYIMAGGYWDYPVHRRGILFAPVYFAPHLHARRHFVYSPSIVIDLGVFPDHLFCRPRYHHYYFGDYYAPAYRHSGFHASFSFHIGRHGYDPIYSHHRWHHRHDRDWHHRLVVSHRHRRDHEDARPPRTWSQQRNLTVTKTRVENRPVVANTYDQYRSRPDRPVRFQTVDRNERQALVQRNREVQTSREQRRTLEATTRENAGARINEGRAVRAQIPKSTIVSKPVREMAPQNAPPTALRAPRRDSAIQPNRQETRDNRGEVRDRDRNRIVPRASQSSPATKPGIPERQLNTRTERRESTAPQQPGRQGLIPTPQKRRVPSAPSRQQSAPSAPAPERRVPTPPQREQRDPAASPQSQVIQPQAVRPVPSSPPQERRIPRVERPRQSAPAPAAIPNQSQRNFRSGDSGRVSPQRPANTRQSDRKGAEQLKGGRKDR